MSFHQLISPKPCLDGHIMLSVYTRVLGQITSSQFDTCTGHPGHAVDPISNVISLFVTS